MDSTTKENIVQSAIDLFSEKGYSDTSVKEIAASSGITTGSIYNYFTSKEDLLNHIFKMYYGKMYERVASREEIDRMVDTYDARTIFEKALFFLEGSEQEKYQKILKIILQEQYRNKQAGAFVKNVLCDEVKDYLHYVLKKLCDAKMIKPVDPHLYAAIINATNVASIIEFAHYSPNEFFSRTPVTRLDIINHIFDTLVI